MKRIGNLYQQAFSKEALLLAFHSATKHKRGKRACFEFERRLAGNIDELEIELRAGIYKPKPYYQFIVTEPKPRMIYAPAFRDLVVQHAIYAVVSPIFDKTFIDQSYACRTGRGTHQSAAYAQSALQKSEPGSYTLKLDIRKFFYRIDRAVLRVQIERKIKDARFVDLMMMFADHGEPVGIPIGNLLSQLYALIYLNPLDHYIKRVLKVKLYARYVDDFVLFNISKASAIEFMAKIITFIAGLKLTLSKWTIAATHKGINFIGYRTWASKRFIRKRSLYNFKKALKLDKLDSLTSIIGHAKHTHSHRYLINTMKEKYDAKDIQLYQAV